MTDKPTVPFHGTRRFRRALERRYSRYFRPTLMRAVCTRCGAPFAFFATPKPPEIQDGENTGWRARHVEVCGVMPGRGGCGRCGNIVHSLQWPEDAWLKVAVPEGLVWAWNEAHVPLLLARVRGDRVAVRQLSLRDGTLLYFIGRLPKFALLTKNRARILDGFGKLLARDAPATSPRA